MISLKRTTLNLLAVAILGSATACSNTMGPGEGDGPPPPPQAVFENRYDVSLTVRYVEVTGRAACDGYALISGNPRNGEFQYRLEAESPRAFRSTESTNYGSVLGRSYGRKPGENIDFSNQTWTFSNLRDGDLVALRVFGSEWDGTGKDSRMNNRRRAKEWTMSERTTNGRLANLRLTTGIDPECKLTLVYDFEGTRRQVEIR